MVGSVGRVYFTAKYVIVPHSQNVLILRTAKLRGYTYDFLHIFFLSKGTYMLCISGESLFSQLSNDAKQ